jgi:hypothetical protein
LNLAIAEVALQNSKHVLDPSRDHAEPAFPYLLALGEVAIRLGFLPHRQQHARRFGRTSLFVAGVALVAMDRPIILVDQADP